MEKSHSVEAASTGSIFCGGKFRDGRPGTFPIPVSHNPEDSSNLLNGWANKVPDGLLLCHSSPPHLNAVRSDCYTLANKPFDKSPDGRQAGQADSISDQPHRGTPIWWSATTLLCRTTGTRVTSAWATLASLPSRDRVRSKIPFLVSADTQIPIVDSGGLTRSHAADLMSSLFQSAAQASSAP